MKNWTLEWHSIKTGMEGISYELAETSDQAKSIYQNKYKWREVKAISETIDGDRGEDDRRNQNGEHKQH